MAVHREYFAKLSRHPVIVGIVTELIGDDIKLLQSMSLLKPPGRQGENQCAVLYKGISYTSNIHKWTIVPIPLSDFLFSVMAVRNSVACCYLAIAITMSVCLTTV